MGVCPRVTVSHTPRSRGLGDAMARQLRSVTMVMLLAILFVGVVAYLMTQCQHERSQMPTQHFGIADPALPPGSGWRHLVTRVVAGVTAAPKANGPEDADLGRNAMDWRAAEHRVRRLRQRIASWPLPLHGDTPS